MNSKLLTFSKFSVLFATYYLTAKLGLSLNAVSGFATLVWPPSGIALAALLLWGRSIWPAIFAAALLVNVATGAPLAVAFGIACGNTMEPILGAWLLSRVAAFDLSLSRTRDALSLLVLSASLSTAISATFGVGSLLFGGIISEAEVLSTWTAWWIGDMLGVLVVTPLLLTWRTSPIRRDLRWNHFVEIAAVTFIFVAICAVIFPFTDDTGPSAAKGPTVFLLFPIVIWSALRTGQLGGTLATFLIAVVAIVSTMRGRGPFVAGDVGESLLILQLFMGVLATTSLVMGAVATESRTLLRKLQAAVQAREDFLAMASHDLKNPLSTIMMATDLSLRAPAPAHIHLIRRSAQNMLSLIHDFLAVSKIEAGVLTLETRPCAAPDLVAEACQALQTLAADRAVDLRQDVKTSLPTFTCDREQILRVFSNLIGNAIKFTSAGGWVKVSARAENNVVRFSVSDNGPGISSEELPHIFDRYWQARKTAKSGTGLGLFIAKGIVESHGGQLWVESSLGEGSTFHFTLTALTDTKAPPSRSK